MVRNAFHPPSRRRVRKEIRWDIKKILLQFADDAVVSTDSDRIMEIKVGYPKFVPKSCAGDLKMSCICVGQGRFIFLLSKEVDSMY